MSNTFIDKACAVVPKFENRISIFHKKLYIAQYAEKSIYDYKLKIAQAALYLQKLPDDFTQDDIEAYLSSLLDQKRYSISYFKRKHSIPSTLLEIKQICNQENPFLTFEVGYTGLIAHGARDS